jgi:hypothetical protein
MFSPARGGGDGVPSARSEELLGPDTGLNTNPLATGDAFWADVFRPESDVSETSTADVGTGLPDVELEDFSGRPAPLHVEKGSSDESAACGSWGPAARVRSPVEAEQIIRVSKRGMRGSTISDGAEEAVGGDKMKSIGGMEDALKAKECRIMVERASESDQEDHFFESRSSIRLFTPGRVLEAPGRYETSPSPPLHYLYPERAQHGLHASSRDHTPEEYPMSGALRRTASSASPMSSVGLGASFARLSLTQSPFGSNQQEMADIQQQVDAPPPAMSIPAVSGTSSPFEHDAPSPPLLRPIGAFRPLSTTSSPGKSRAAWTTTTSSGDERASL